MVKFQRNIAILAVVLFVIKIIAWRLTASVAIFTDALESTVNVVSGFLGLYSVWLAAKPRDENHPYGHGKVEYVSAAVEGTLIMVAGLMIIYHSVIRLWHPQPIEKLDIGLVLITITAFANGIVGYRAQQIGKKNRSAAIQAGGHHLLSDTYSTIGIIIGLLMVKLTGWLWMDAVVGIVFAIIILYTGYKVLRESLAGIMDEADLKFLEEFIAFIQSHRTSSWIDLHNLRLIRYGTVMHIDAHMTLPWYMNVQTAHDKVQELEILIQNAYQNAVELFVHVDFCSPMACKICSIDNCTERKYPFENTIPWTLENVLKNKQHGT